ncbi:N-acetylglucosamine-phosphate mutase [Apiospora marii]|uniref:N-acetylglucosamine-phosphate mutase n=1 Tax=Apiospora marii TaxID=335849 RepID=A0ABR1SSY6_9PEZI
MAIVPATGMGPPGHVTSAQEPYPTPAQPGSRHEQPHAGQLHHHDPKAAHQQNGGGRRWVGAIRKLAGQAIGVMVAASHNPAKDNGVKIVGPMGDMLEQKWEVYATQLANCKAHETPR